MREIKFRCWDGKDRMFYPGDGFTDTMVLCWYPKDGKFQSLAYGSADYDWDVHGPYKTEIASSVMLMEFTGLKDKNGTDIYEGDIVKCHDHPTGEEDCLSVVQYEQGEWSVGTMIPMAHYGTAWTEIIGNIYQSPELLNKEK